MMKQSYSNFRKGLHISQHSLSMIWDWRVGWGGGVGEGAAQITGSRWSGRGSQVWLSCVCFAFLGTAIIRWLYKLTVSDPG